MDKALFFARAWEDEPLPAVFQRDQSHRFIRELRELFRIRETLHGIGGRGDCVQDGGPGRGHSLKGEHGEGKEGDGGTTLKCRAPPASAAEDASAGQESSFPAVAPLLIQQIVEEILFLRFHGKERV